jgi:hypothetical protein
MLGGSQPVVLSLDPANGAPRWAAAVPRDLNGTGVTGMALDARGNIFLTGLTPTAVSPSFANRGSSDPYVLRFDPSGVLTGTWQGGSAGDDEADAIALDACGRILVAGSTGGVLAGAASAGRRDAFLVSVQLQPE